MAVKTTIGTSIMSGGSLLTSSLSISPGKNAVTTIGSKYPAVRIALTRSMTTKIALFSWRPPIARYHLLTKPFDGGSPIRDIEATEKQPIVMGIFFPMPLISPIVLYPVLYIITPTQKKRVIFIAA